MAGEGQVKRGTRIGSKSASNGASWGWILPCVFSASLIGCGTSPVPRPAAALKQSRKDGQPLADWVAIIGTGQSLSVGAGAPPISTVQPYHNLKLLDSGPDPRYPLDGGGDLSLVPLVEPIKPHLLGYDDTQYPNNIAGETPNTAWQTRSPSCGSIASGATTSPSNLRW